MASFVFIDAPHRDGWPDTGGLAELSSVAGELAARGHDVSVAAFAHWQLGHRHWPKTVRRRTIPLIERPAVEVAPGGLGHGRPAYDSLCVAQWLEGERFDVAVAPEAGGIAAHVAMAVAAGAMKGPGIALWATGGARARLLRDRRPAQLVDLVGDALERAALAAADAVIRPVGPAIGLSGPALVGNPARRRPPRREFTDIALIGDMGEGAGILCFIDALERLQRAGHLAGRSVSFIGPVRRHGPGASAETFAPRAREWTFAWNILDNISARDAVAAMAEPRRISVFGGAEAGFPGLLAASVAAGAVVVAPASRLTRELVAASGHRTNLYRPRPDHLARCLGNALARPASLWSGPAPEPGETASSWADRVEEVARSRTVARSTGRRRRGVDVSVCVIHRDRPNLLQRAIASVRADRRVGEVEIVLVDDASETPAARMLVAGGLAGVSDAPLTIITNARPRFPAGARNQAAAKASGKCLVFLDDDNWLLEGGLCRLVAAVNSGCYDVVTSALDVEQPGIAAGTPALRVAFLGDAGIAGLVYNGFGDASLAITAKAFNAVGGFPDEGVMAPAEDWAFLARCRSAGLRMASLWQPCFGYRKPVDLALTSWRKNHKEGALARVRAAYGNLQGDDLALALAYLQGLDLARQADG